MIEIYSVSLFFDLLVPTFPRAVFINFHYMAFCPQYSIIRIISFPSNFSCVSLILFGAISFVLLQIQCNLNSGFCARLNIGHKLLT